MGPVSTPGKESIKTSAKMCSLQTPWLTCHNINKESLFCSFNLIDCGKPPKGLEFLQNWTAVSEGDLSAQQTWKVAYWGFHNLWTLLHRTHTQWKMKEEKKTWIIKLNYTFPHYKAKTQNFNFLFELLSFLISYILMLSVMQVAVDCDIKN